MTASSATLPRIFGKYLLCERIGAGGMAEVFRAMLRGASGFEKDVVIKRLRTDVTERPDAVQMLVREAKIAVSLRHSTIVQVLELGEVDGQYYIAMEFVHGRDLHKIIEACAVRAMAVPPAIAAHIGMQVALGLDYAHRRTAPGGTPLGIVHRDVSPTNVMVSAEGEVKVLDFGIATARGTEFATQDGLIKGTYPYLSPEQAAGRPLDHRSDLFSLGSVLYELCTLRRAFLEDNVAATIHRIFECRFDTPQTHRPDLPPALCGTICRLLEHDRDKRFASGAEVHEALAPLGATVTAPDLAAFLVRCFPDDEALRRPSLAPPRTATTPSPSGRDSAGARVLVTALHSPADKDRRRGLRLALAGGGSLGLAILVLGWALATRRGDQSPSPVAPVAPPAPPVAIAEVPPGPPRTEPAPPPKARPATKVAIRDPRPTGYLRLASEPWAFVDLDGRRLDKPTPLLDYAVPAGPHTLRLTNPEIGKTVELRIVIRPAETLTKRVSLVRP